MSKKNETFCSVCGFVIPTERVGARLDCEGVDFIARSYIEMEMVVCEECVMKIRAIDVGGMPKAIKRSKLLVVKNDALL